MRLLLTLLLRLLGIRPRYRRRMRPILIADDAHRMCVGGFWCFSAASQRPISWEGYWIRSTAFDFGFRVCRSVGEPT